MVIGPVHSGDNVPQDVHPGRSEAVFTIIRCWGGRGDGLGITVADLGIVWCSTAQSTVSPVAVHTVVPTLCTGRDGVRTGLGTGSG